MKKFPPLGGYEGIWKIVHTTGKILATPLHTTPKDTQGVYTIEGLKIHWCGGSPRPKNLKKCKWSLSEISKGVGGS